MFFWQADLQADHFVLYRESVRANQRAASLEEGLRTQVRQGEQEIQSLRKELSEVMAALALEGLLAESLLTSSHIVVQCFNFHHISAEPLIHSYRYTSMTFLYM